MFILTVYYWFMLWNLNMIPGNVLMNAGGFLMVPDDCWWLCQIAADFGPRPNVRRLGMVVPIPAASFADYCSDMDLSRAKPTELRLCRLFPARFSSVLPQRLNESAAGGGQRWAAFFLSRLIKCSMHLRERQVDCSAVKPLLRRSWWGNLVGRCRQKFESRLRPYLAENRIAWP